MTSLNGRTDPDIDLAASLFDELAMRTGDGKGISRPSFGVGEQIAHELVRREGERLGLQVETDAACNLYLTLPGRNPANRIIIGSHLDSVPQGGNFDGAAGVLCGLSVIAGLAEAGERPARDITLMAIRAEESTWFAASYIGSRAAFGLLESAELDDVRRASDGMQLGEAISAAGGDVKQLQAGRPQLDPAGIGMYIEPHIEQGPCLVTENKPVGIVSGIRGSFRYRNASCAGSYGHSGATPRHLRRDAVRATAALVMAMDEVWDRAERDEEDLSITFGKLATDPAEHAFSKVAGCVDFSLDVRSQSSDTLEQVALELTRLVERLSRQHSVRFDLGPRTGTNPAMMDGKVVAAMEAACSAEGVPAVTLPSGAGHDAAVFAGMDVPTGMLFIRNENGSHNPEESMEMDDFAAAARVLMRICLEPLP